MEFYLLYEKMNTIKKLKDTITRPKLFSKCVSNLETNYNNIYIKNE